MGVILPAETISRLDNSPSTRPPGSKSSCASSSKRGRVKSNCSRKLRRSLPLIRVVQASSRSQSRISARYSLASSGFEARDRSSLSTLLAKIVSWNFPLISDAMRRCPALKSDWRGHPAAPGFQQAANSFISQSLPGRDGDVEFGRSAGSSPHGKAAFSRIFRHLAHLLPIRLRGSIIPVDLRQMLRYVLNNFMHKLN